MYEYYVRKVEGVVDGDTIDVLIDLGFDILFASRVRLAGIDTPESRTKDLAEKKLTKNEIIELKNHPFFIGVQFHPELKSKPFLAHPLFVEFVKSAINYNDVFISVNDNIS